MLRDKTRTTTTYSVSEIYPSIQGEGLLVGTPSLFIRFHGCNLRCPWCDQPESLTFKKPNMDLESLLERVSLYHQRHVVLTGGEPMAQPDLHLLIEELIKRSYTVQIETNGTLWNEKLKDLDIHITCSPKASAKYYVHPEVLRRAKELKFVVDDELSLNVLKREEFLPFLEKGVAILQPEGNKKHYLEKALRLQEELLREGYTVRVIPQIHKLIGLK